MELVEHSVRRLEGGRVRLEALLVYADGARERIWFEVSERHEQALNRSGDPWIVTLAPLAVTLGEPLIVPIPADAKLAEGVRRASAAWRAWDASRAALELEVPTEDRAPNPAAAWVGSLFSGGVDSWCTVLRNLEESAAGRVPRLQALFLVWGADIGLGQPDAFRCLRERLGAVAAELSCELVDIATNLRETRWKRANWPLLAHGSMFIGLAHASGVFRRLLIPSSVPYTNGRGWGSHPITDPMLSSRATEILYDSAELNRLAKIRALCESPLALASLRVCWRSGTEQNCGRCMKCLKTMVALEIYGGLSRCSTFPATRVDPAQVARLRCMGHNDYRMARHLGEECLRLGRRDLSRALDKAYYRSARMDLVDGLLRRLERLGIRGTLRIRDWLERGSIYN